MVSSQSAQEKNAAVKIIKDNILFISYKVIIVQSRPDKGVPAVRGQRWCCLSSVSVFGFREVILNNVNEAVLGISGVA